MVIFMSTFRKHRVFRHFHLILGDRKRTPKKKAKKKELEKSNFFFCFENTNKVHTVCSHQKRWVHRNRSFHILPFFFSYTVFFVNGNFSFVTFLKKRNRRNKNKIKNWQFSKLCRCNSWIVPVIVESLWKSKTKIFVQLNFLYEWTRTTRF